MGPRSMPVRRDKPMSTIIHRMPGKCNPKVSVEHKMKRNVNTVTVWQNSDKTEDDGPGGQNGR